MTGNYRRGRSLWDEEDGFFYDVLHLPDGRVVPLKVRSLVGLMPLLAVETLEPDVVENLPVFKQRLNWFFENRIFLRDSGNVACIRAPGEHSRRLLSIINRERLVRILRLIRLFLKNAEGKRPVYGGQRLFQDDSHWRDLILFHEYFHGDNGAGLGAGHQTGWTGLVAKLIQQSGGTLDPS